MCCAHTHKQPLCSWQCHLVHVPMCAWACKDLCQLARAGHTQCMNNADEVIYFSQWLTGVVGHLEHRIVPVMTQTTAQPVNMAVYEVVRLFWNGSGGSVTLQFKVHTYSHPIG